MYQKYWRKLLLVEEDPGAEHIYDGGTKLREIWTEEDEIGGR
jgi:hypothetical protein